jgi:hypothetical protein
MMHPFRSAALAMMMLLMPALQAAPAGIRPGPPPPPLGASPAAAPAAGQGDEARRPGPPPDPLGEDRRA